VLGEPKKAEDSGGPSEEQEKIKNDKFAELVSQKIMEQWQGAF